MKQITIDNISGVEYPVNVYIADIFGNYKTFLGEITIGPVPPEIIYNYTIPTIFQSAPEVMVIIEDANLCETFQILPCLFSTPTPTPTQTPTLTPTVTPGLSPTQTPTNTKTPTPTTTTSQTPTASQTPTPTPTNVPYYAYIFAEPQVESDSDTLLSYAIANGAQDWGSWFSVGLPNNNSGNYSNDLNVYAHQPSFIFGSGNFIPVNELKAPIAQYQGQIINGLSQNLHTFGSIEIPFSLMNPDIRYFYTIWLPLEGIGNSLIDMTIDVGVTLGDDSLFDDIGTIIGLTSLNVTVNGGTVLPPGDYRVLWVSPNFELPTTLPSNGSLFFRGVNKI